jgi:hypothetical protein
LQRGDEGNLSNAFAAEMEKNSSVRFYLYSFAEMLSSIASDITSDEMITISWGLALT